MPKHQKSLDYIQKIQKASFFNELLKHGKDYSRRASLSKEFHNEAPSNVSDFLTKSVLGLDSTKQFLYLLICFDHK